MRIALLLLGFLFAAPLHGEEAKPNETLRRQFEEDMVGLAKAYRNELDSPFNERTFRKNLAEELKAARNENVFCTTAEEASQLAAGKFLIAAKPFARAMQASRNDFTDWYKYQKSLNPYQQLLAFRLAAPKGTKAP